MKECPQCKTMLEDDELFCHECGTKQDIEDLSVQEEETATTLEKKCIHCGEMIEADSAFCPFCGKPQTKLDQLKKQETIPQSDKEQLTAEKELESAMAGDEEYVVENRQEENKSYTAFKPHKKKINEKALEESVIYMIESHRRRFQEEVDKTVTTTLKPLSYPNASLLLFSDTNQQTVLKMQINKTVKEDAALYEKIKNSQYYQSFSKYDPANGTALFMGDFHNDGNLAKNTILDVLVTIYNQPHECAIGYVNNVSGYNRPKPETTEKVKKKKSKAWLWILVLILILAAGIGGWYYFAQTDSYEQPKELTAEAVAEDFEQNEDAYVEPDYEDNNEKDGMKAFLDDFYMHYMNENYLKSHVTPAVLNKLKDDFPYDCDRGDCLGTWVFMACPLGADMDLEDGPFISNTDEYGKYKVDYKYSYKDRDRKGFETCTVYITVTEKEGKYLVSDYKVDYSDNTSMKDTSNSTPLTNDNIVMSGMVSKYNIHMVLQIEGTNVMGYYYYDSQGSGNRVKLSGNINEDNIMKLEKYNSQGSQTGYFEGRFDGNTYSGSNINYSRDESLPFSVEKIN